MSDVGAISFDGQVAIVTGAGRGLGRGYALELASRGARVVVNDVGASLDGQSAEVDVAESVVAEIGASGGTAVASTASVSEPAGADLVVTTALDAFGRVDAVVCNAGIVRNGPLESITMADFHAVVETHLVGSFLVARAAFGPMREQQYGRFVFTSSGAGLFGRTDGANYASAKAGIFGLANSVALEGEQFGVAANVILPVARTRLANTVQLTADQDEAMRIINERRGPSMTPDFVVPMVVYLASERCTVSKEVYSAVAGRYARVFLGVADGWTVPTESPAPSAEDISNHLHRIRDISAFALPTSVFEEMRLAAVGRET